MYRPKIKADKIGKKSRVRAPLYINFPYKKKEQEKNAITQDMKYKLWGNRKKKGQKCNNTMRHVIV